MLRPFSGWASGPASFDLHTPAQTDQHAKPVSIGVENMGEFPSN